MRPTNKKIIDSILLALDKAKLPIFLGLLGGEPTLTLNYYELLERINNIIIKNENNRCYITTNGIKDSSWWKQHPKYNNFYILWSFHPEYMIKNINSVSEFLNCIDIAVKKDFKIKVNLVLTDDPNHWVLLEYVRTELKKRYNNNLNFEIHPHYLYNGIHNINNYSKEFWNYWNHLKQETNVQYKFIDESNNINFFNEYEIFTEKLNIFYDWDCWNNNYEINTNGNVLQLCNNDLDNLVSNSNYFANINEIKPIKCKYQSCCCDGLLKIYKEKI
jgi:hypothetical protein